MKRLVVRAASALLGASLTLMAGCLAPALAGDAADFAALGFSPDGRYFAYEEFGIQDGSGFPYSNIFILDVAEDEWAGGSPFRVRLDEEQPGLAGARAEARKQAGQVLADLAINEPAVIAALHGDGEVGMDGATITFGAPGYGLDPPRDPITLTLSSFPSTSTEPCVESYGFEPPVGFALALKSEAATAEFHRDKTVPASRGCTLAYRLYGIVAPAGWAPDALTPVAIVSVYSHGFEGPDRRFIAVPVPVVP